MSYFRSAVIEKAKELAQANYCEWVPEVLRMTEGRKDSGGITYSWCGDFVTYTLMMCGADRNTHFLNRAEINGQWKIGRNIEMIVQAGEANGTIYRAAALRARMADPASAGDILIIDVPNGGHICIYGGPINGASYRTFDGNSIGGCTRERFRPYTEQVPLAMIDADTFTTAGSSPTGGPSLPNPPSGFPTASSVEGGLAAELAQSAATIFGPDSLMPFSRTVRNDQDFSVTNFLDPLEILQSQISEVDRALASARIPLYRLALVQYRDEPDRLRGKVRPIEDANYIER